ncbi:MAG: type VI secretion system lipoprotein TssJ [Pseudomonadota bacterium]|nr:type VI secretion system lipoprotein TssJ [Pseudomonadales bacterium]MDY6920098.1 type VI secretion system lipoprotein TssJ [Pseudomonadota bacterium]
MRWGWLVTVLILGVLLSGCTYFLSDVTKVDLRLVAGGDVNPDDSGRPSPVVVRILELKSPAVFETADFFALYQDPEQTLGADLVALEEVEFKPGDVRDFKLGLQPESGYVAIMAAYRRLEQANWRLVLPLRSGHKNAVTVLLNRRGVELASPR